jgi:hypothetical protein
MPKRYKVEFSKIWFTYDDEGKRQYDESISWDGRAYSWPLNEALIFITDEAIQTHFPMVWWPNEELSGNYVRGTYLRDVTEFLVYTAAHEVRHLEQWRNPRMGLMGKGFPGSDIETDADLYAILKLNSWRKIKG